MSDDDLHIVVKDLNGVAHKLPALAGWRVMEIIRDSGLPIKAECGGCMACATCHVYIDPEWASRIIPARNDEQDMIADFAIAPKATSRLSCQIIMSDELNGLSLSLAPNPD
jgi:ferredoxin, 2Fe-2S